MRENRDIRGLPTIAWDVDDVLNNLTYAWYDEYVAAHAQDHLPPFSELLENPPHRLLNINRDSYLASLDDFRARRMLTLTPVSELCTWFEKYGAFFNHMALTAVPQAFAHLSAHWVIKHFGRWIRTFHFVPSHRDGIATSVYDINKAEFVKRTACIDIFIDDNEDNVYGVRESAGIKTVIFPAPWNSRRNASVQDCLETIISYKKKENLS